jgi:hypothetical protein
VFDILVDDEPGFFRLPPPLFLRFSSIERFRSAVDTRERGNPPSFEVCRPFEFLSDDSRIEEGVAAPILCGALTPVEMELAADKPEECILSSSFEA